MYGTSSGKEVMASTTHRWQQPTVSEGPPVENCSLLHPSIRPSRPTQNPLIPRVRIRAPGSTGPDSEHCTLVSILCPQCPGNCEKGDGHSWLKPPDLGNSSQLKKKKKRHKEQRGGGERGWEGTALIFRVRPFYLPRHPCPRKYGRG